MVQRSPGAPAVAAPPATTSPPGTTPVPAATDEQLNKDVNSYADERLADCRRDFSNGISAFRNWYFEQDEGMEPLFADFKTIVRARRRSGDGPARDLIADTLLRRRSPNGHYPDRIPHLAGEGDRHIRCFRAA
jgi:hypothetical protein